MLLPSLALLPFAALSVLAHAAPPNPDQLFALQEAAASRASAHQATNTPQHVRPHHGKHLNQTGRAQPPKHAKESDGVVKRHLRTGGRGHAGMQRVKRGAAVVEKQKVRRASPLDSSSTEEEEERSDLEARQQIPLASEKADKEKETSLAEPTPTANKEASKTASKIIKAEATKAAGASHYSGDGGLGGYWAGASSYYLYALADGERRQVLDAIKDGGFKVVRIFVAYVGHNNKVGSFFASTRI